MMRANNFVSQLLISLLLLNTSALFAAEKNGSKPWELTLEEVKARVYQVQPGADLLPTTWPGKAKVAVLFSFDVDNESLAIVEDADIFVASMFQYGGRRGTERIVRLLDRENVPATFFVPAMSLQLVPELVPLIKQSGNHEFGMHGWIHEKASDMSAQEQLAVMERTVKYITKVTGERPVGYRAPYGVLTEHTIPNLQKLGFKYDSGFTADDRPYELLVSGEKTGLVELPASLNLEDSVLDVANTFTAGILPPGEVLQSYKDAFDVAYEEGGMLLFIMHPHVSGRLSRIKVIERFIAYAKKRGNVWFATHDQAAEYVKQQYDNDK
jgi:peptidoglycan-N-acetylglucosamine deacetylase